MKPQPQPGMIDLFQKWLGRRQRDIFHVAGLLNTELSREPEGLINNVTAIEAWYARTNEIFSECESWLEQSRKFYLPAREEGITEGERKASMESAVSDIKKLRNTLEGYVDGIKQRISLAQSILKYEVATRDLHVVRKSQ